MNTKDILGRTITDILVCSKMEVGGLDQAEVFIQLNNNEIIGIPWDFDSENIEKELPEDAESLFNDLDDTPVYNVNPEQKTIQEITDAKKKREASILGRIKKAIGIREGIPKEYQPYEIEYIENELKYLKNQKIINFIISEEPESTGFIELENGYLITETFMSPHGTGAAGLSYYESVDIFEKHYGSNCKKLK